MDPTSNPTPTQAPTPVPGTEPVSNNTTPEVSGLDLTNPAPEPVAPTPVTPVAPTAPVVTPTPVAPVEPVTPVNPVINPSGQATNPVFQPTSGVSATEPIMMPEAPTPPDPVEEELKAPMKAAEPVPGSIGSAISGPAGATGNEVPTNNVFATEPQATPSVSFNDPAMQQQNPMPIGTGTPKTPGKTNKTTLIILIAVAAAIVVALAVILIMQLTGK